jgi:hypothetical protein
MNLNTVIEKVTDSYLNGCHSVHFKDFYPKPYLPEFQYLSFLRVNSTPQSFLLRYACRADDAFRKRLGPAIPAPAIVLPFGYF